MPVIFGIHAVSEALKARRVSRLLHVRGGGPRIDALVARARELRIAVETLDRLALDRMARGGVHQGVAADLQPLPAFTVEELVSDAEAPALARRARRDRGSAERRRHPAIGGCRRRDGHRFARRVMPRRFMARRQRRRRAPSATCGLRRSSTSPDALEELKALGVWTVGLDAGAAAAYDDVDYTLPTALVFGAEATGLRRLVRERCDRVVAIPMRGHVGSLNVSVSAGIALFEAVRQRRARGPEAAVEGRSWQRVQRLGHNERDWGSRAAAGGRRLLPSWHVPCYHSRFVWLA